jgi:hypothetical protein
VKRRNAAAGFHGTVIDFRTGAIRSLLVSGIVRTSAFPSGRREDGQDVAPEALHILAERREAGRIRVVDVTGSSLPVSYQVGALEDSQVLRDRRPADRQIGGQLRHRTRLRPNELEHPSSRGVGERLKRDFVSFH